MIFRLVTIFIVTFLIISCAGGTGVKVVNEPEDTVSKDQNIYLMPPKFSDTNPLVRVKSECSMLDVLKDSIITTAPKYKLNVEYLEKDMSFNEGDLRMMVEFVDVTPHRWTFMAVRPSSTATFRISIYKGAELSETITKSITSGMALGACDRLEKIALATGRYVSKWVSLRI